MKMPKWIERRWERSLSRAQCSPSYIILLAIVVLAAIVFQYRTDIIRTIEGTLLIAASLLVLSGLSMLGFTAFRWNRAKSQAFLGKAATIRGSTTPAPADDSVVNVPDDIAGIGGEEEHIARARQILAKKK